jgi:hypothetical protein
MENPAEISIISQLGTCIGKISCNIKAHNDDNNEFEEVPSDPFDLVGQSLNFSIYIKNVTDILQNFSKGIYIEYTSFTDNVTYKTKIIENKTGNHTFFDEIFYHKIEYLTKEDIEFMMNEKVNLIFSYQLIYFSFVSDYLLMRKLKKKEK